MQTSPLRPLELEGVGLHGGSSRGRLALTDSTLKWTFYEECKYQACFLPLMWIFKSLLNTFTQLDVLAKVA